MPDLSGAPSVRDGGGRLSVEGLARQALAVIDAAGFTAPMGSGAHQAHVNIDEPTGQRLIALEPVRS